jgi:hypothetical protein
MNDLALADLERRLRRLERQNRVLVALLCAALAGGTIAASNAQQGAITTYEIRAQRFTLLDPNGGVADNWYTNSSPDGPNMTRRLDAGYSGWGYSAP